MLIICRKDKLYLFLFGNFVSFDLIKRFNVNREDSLFL